MDKIMVMTDKYHETIYQNGKFRTPLTIHFTLSSNH